MIYIILKSRETIIVWSLCFLNYSKVHLLRSSKDFFSVLSLEIVISSYEILVPSYENSVSSYETKFSSCETKISSCEKKISWDEIFVSKDEKYFETRRIANRATVDVTLQGAG
jgi:hypothetical protein